MGRLSRSASVLLSALLIAVGGCRGDDGDDGDRGGGASTGPRSDGFIGAIELEPLDKTEFLTPGQASIYERGSKRELAVEADVKPNRPDEAYEVWLYNNRTDARSLGAQITNAAGEFRGRGRLPAHYERYRYIDVSIEPVNKDDRHSGRSILRGKL